MKPISLCSLIVTLLCTLHPVLTQAQDSNGGQPSMAADPVVGRWRWFTNEWAFIRADGTLTKGGPVVGHWRCVNETEWPRKYVLNWGGGIWVDTLFLKRDGSLLSGTNQQHNPVHGTRRKSVQLADENGAPEGSGSLVDVAPSGPVPHVFLPARRLPGSPEFRREHLAVPHAPALGTRPAEPRLPAGHAAHPGPQHPKAGDPRARR